MKILAFIGKLTFSSKIEHNVITDFSLSQKQVLLAFLCFRITRDHMHLEIIRLANIKIHKLRTFQDNHLICSSLQICKE